MFPIKKITNAERPALYFLLKLLLLLWLLKTIFFFYNAAASGGWSLLSVSNLINLFGWSLLYDALAIAIINFTLILLVIVLPSAWWKNAVGKTGFVLFALANAFMLLLNAADIFYFPFHLQRADADLLYVLRNPFASGMDTFLVWLAIIGLYIVLVIVLYYLLGKSFRDVAGTGKPFLTLMGIAAFLLLIVFGNKQILLPTYPLTSIKPVQLPLAQNSLHTFLYSVYRREEITLPQDYGLPLAEQQTLFKIEKAGGHFNGERKNIVLFIMESVSADFFDSAGAFKVAMPFMDSLLAKSTYFSNAYSYSYSSNKGITAILAGMPTLIDIPFYHSNFTGIKKTSIGVELAKRNYESSFFIGDNYDDFGFAQCCNWLGIQHYYSMESVPGYQQMNKHPMGLHDEYVLQFMQEKITQMQQPFLAINYNISTHFPSSVPPGFRDAYPGVNTTAPMKSMAYYSRSLQQFFAAASKQAWYANTIFIFCSDHWATPDVANFQIDNVGSFHIPIFIFDPSHPEKKVVSSPVSQLDILNTILFYSGQKDSIISYGQNLADTNLNKHRTVFTKTNTAVYQAINDTYVLGFNASEGKAVYCYNYKTDPGKQNNLLQLQNIPEINKLILETKAFLQTGAQHYRNELLK